MVFARIHCTEKCLTSFLNNVISESKQRFLRVCSSFRYTPFPAHVFSWSNDARKSSLSSLLWVQTLSQILSYEDRAWIIEINCTDDNFFFFVTEYVLCVRSLTLSLTSNSKNHYLSAKHVTRTPEYWEYMGSTQNICRTIQPIAMKLPQNIANI